MESKKIEFFNSLSFITFISTLFVSIFFFIPFVPINLSASKGFLIFIGITLSVFFWLISRLGEGKFTVPKDRIILFAGIIPLVFLISSFFSPSLYLSLFGNGFEVGTFGSILIMSCIFFLSSIHFQKEKNIWIFFGSLFISSIIVLIFELFNIFIGFDKISPTFLLGVSSGNLVGTWSDFALFLGLIVTLSIFTIEFLKTSKILLIAQYFILIFGLIFLIIVNMPLVWVLVGIFSVAIFIYKISLQNKTIEIVGNIKSKNKFPFVALVFIFISIFFLVSNNLVSSFLLNYINISNNDVYPSFATTSQIAYKSIIQNPLFGTGPNTFLADWSLWKPIDIAQTAYWNIDFSYGFSLLYTLLVSTGILGFLSLLLFIATIFIKSVKSLKIALSNTVSNYFIFSTIIIIIYSWVSIISYNPNIIIVSLAFVSSGILIGILVHKKVIPVKQISFLSEDRNNFISIFILMVLMIGALSLTYIYVEKFSSIIYYSSSLSNNNTTIKSLSSSEKMLSNAIFLDKNDAYYRSLSGIYIKEMSIIVADKTIAPDVLKSDLQLLINKAQQSSQLAINQNPKNYLNYLNQGDVYGSFVLLPVDGSYEKAVASYDKALKLAPSNPNILLARASLEFINKNNPEARKFIKQALDLKNNYTDAIFFLAQIEVNEGNMAEAIKQAEYAASLSPNDATVFFRLGLLRYNNSDYTGSIDALERAVIIDSTYVNAHYFLGQAYQKAGRTDDALIQYKLLSKAFPDNQVLKDAISSISSPVSTTIQASSTTTTNPTTTKKVKLPLPAKK